MGIDSILVVEDDADLRELLKFVLTDAGYTVALAKHGKEALQVVERAMPQIILLDMKMPVMDGWQFVRAFRERYGRRALIVVLTAAADVRRYASDVQAEGWLGKPFGLDEILATVLRFTPPLQY